MSSTNGTPGYEVSYLAPVHEALNGWKRLAVQLDLQSAFIAAIREVGERLARDPRDWGDPLRELRGMNATYYRHYGPVLVVTYAVHNVRPVVFVQQVWLTPGSPMQHADGDPPIW
jgi:hypothetical protein